ncbi:MAG: hypothetical protein JW969_05895 [Spirochaetales bacterium]|nr:hypothetical protein [Spirochaetales bacterium]
MRKICTLVVLLSFISPLNAENGGLYLNTPVLEYSYLDIILSGTNNNLQLSNDLFSVHLNLVNNVNWFFQNKDFMIRNTNLVAFDYYHHEGSPPDPTNLFLCIDSFSSDLKWYFYNKIPFPVNLHFNVTGDYSYRNYTTPDSEYGIGPRGGIGLGRMINIAPVTKAIKLCDALGIERNSQTVYGLAAIIGRRYVYIKRYREDWEKAYLNDLNNAIGGSADLLDIALILDEIGNVAVNNIGYEINLDGGIYYHSAMPELYDKKIYLTADVSVPFNTMLQLSGYFAGDFDFDLMAISRISIYQDLKFHPVNPVIMEFLSSYTYNWNGLDYDNVFELSAGIDVRLLYTLTVGLSGLAVFVPDENDTDIELTLSFEWDIL